MPKAQKLITCKTPDENCSSTAKRLILGMCKYHYDQSRKPPKKPHPWTIPSPDRPHQCEFCKRYVKRLFNKDRCEMCHLRLRRKSDPTFEAALQEKNKKRSQSYFAKQVHIAEEKEAKITGDLLEITLNGNDLAARAKIDVKHIEEYLDTLVEDGLIKSYWYDGTRNGGRKTFLLTIVVKRSMELFFNAHLNQKPDGVLDNIEYPSTTPSKKS